MARPRARRRLQEGWRWRRRRRLPRKSRASCGPCHAAGGSALPQTSRQRRARLDGLHADRGLELLHARHAPDLHPQQLIELRDLPYEHVHQVIRLAGGREALQYGRMARGGGFELRVPGGIDADVHERVHPQAQTLGVELGAVPADQALPLELSHALPAGSLRQTDLEAELGEGGAGVVLQQADDVTVDLVHRWVAFCGAGRTKASVLPWAAQRVHYEDEG